MRSSPSATGGVGTEVVPDIVLDASVVMAHFLPGEDHAEGATVLMDRAALEGVAVPGLWRTEVGNALLSAERRRRITAADADRVLATLAAMPVSVDCRTGERAWSETLALARRHSLTLYDAAYLELAIRLGATLAA